MADERDRIEQAERLDAFWDDLVRGDGRFAPPPSGSPDDLESFALVQQLQSIAPAAEVAAQERLRQRVFGAGSLAANGSQPLIQGSTSPNGHIPAATIPSAPGRLSQFASFAAMAALLVAVTGGFFLLNVNRGWFGSDDPQDTVPAPLSAGLQATPESDVAEQLATPALNPSQLSAGNRIGILWSLAPAAGEVTNSYAALTDGTIYRLTESEEFTGVESIDAGSGSVNWSKPLNWTGSGIDGDGQAIYVPVDESGDEADSVVALDVESGEQLWRTNATWFAETVTVSDSVVYVWDGFRHMEALNALSGAMLWHAGDSDRIPAESRTDVTIPKPIVAGDQIVVVNASGQISGIDTSGAYTWSHDAFATGDVQVVRADDGAIVAAGLDAPEGDEPVVENFATVLTIDPASGEILWEKDILSESPSVEVVGLMVIVLADVPGRPPESATLEAEDGTETVITDDRSNAPLHVYGLELATGEIIFEEFDPSVYSASASGWVSDAGSLPYTSLAPFGPDDELVLALSEPGRITSLSSVDASIVGIIDLGGAIDGLIASGEDGVYPLLTDGTLVSVDPDVLTATTGLVADQETDEESSLDWTLPLPMQDGQFSQLGSTAAANGIIYRLIEATEAKSVQAVHGPNGQFAWQAPVDWSIAGIAADSSGVYLVNEANQVVALDPFTGAHRWNASVSEVGVTGFVLEGERLYVWEASNGMLALDTSDGSVIWETPTVDDGRPDPYVVLPMAPIMADGKLVMISTAGNLYAFDPDSGEILWSAPGFESITSGMAYQPGTLFALTADARPTDDEGEMTGTALDLETGEVKWAIELEGPLYQPVATNETSFYLIANEVAVPSTLEDAEQPFVDYDGPEPGSWTPSRSAAPQQYVGGTHVFGIDAETGSVIWSRSTLAGGFVQLWTGCPNSCGLRVVTSDGYVVGLARDSGSVSGDPMQLEGEPVEVISGGATDLNGDFATLADGTLVAFGHVPYREQG